MPKIRDNTLDVRAALREKAKELFPEKTLFSVKELSQLSGISAGTIYNNKKKYPFVGRIPLDTFARYIS